MLSNSLMEINVSTSTILIKVQKEIKEELLNKEMSNTKDINRF